jgi:hypothetical protein
VTPLGEASAELRQVRDWLLRPTAETLDACAPALERAAAQIAALVQNPPSPPASSFQTAATDLAAEILQAQALLTSAAELYFGRLRRFRESG